MTVHVGQLSLLDPSELARPQSCASPPPTRQRATERDTTSESAPTDGHDTSATRGGTLLTTGETAELLHVHPRTVQRLVERGELCAVRLGAAVRFDPNDVVALTGRLKRYTRASHSAVDDVRRGRGGSTSFADRLRANREHRTA
jgi:excisionase family DNA binding protein